MASRQRQATVATAEVCSLADLDAIAARITQAIDVAGLEEAVRAGVCQPADYTDPSPAERSDFFLYGADVTPAHIAAGLDVVRPAETAAVLESLASRGHVVLAGPSGSGKSALLWRTARLIDHGRHIVRVMRVADDDDVALLVRHVRRQSPDRDLPVLVCADNLGRPGMAAWPHARRQLVELPGVKILGAARREDLTPEVSFDATVIDPRLSAQAADEIYSAIVDTALPAVLEREEALARADGLLMEFVALVTTGRRIRDVLAHQVADLALPERQLQREALRVVCAAHLLGYPVDADTLPPLLHAPSAQVGDALNRLAGEHLLKATGRTWRGLHDLRTEILLELLHLSPPPTLSATYAEALKVVPVAGRGAAARRAAVRLARAANADLSEVPVTNVSAH